jgi:hypothetical protein
MTMNVQQLVDQMIDQARREYPDVEFSILTPAQNSLLLPSDYGLSGPEHSRTGIYNGHVYRDCLVTTLGSDCLVVLKPALRHGAAVPTYYGDLRTDTIGTTSPDVPMWGDDVAADFRQRILGDDLDNVDRWPLSDWGSAQRVQESLVRQDESGRCRLWPIQDVPDWLATVLDRCELYGSSDVPGPTWAVCVSRSVDWFALAHEHPELDLTVPFDPAPQLEQIRQALDVARRHDAGVVLDLLLCPDTAAGKIRVELNGMAINANTAAADAVAITLGGVGPSKDGPLSSDPDVLAWEWASRWPQPTNPAPARAGLPASPSPSSVSSTSRSRDPMSPEPVSRSADSYDPMEPMTIAYGDLIAARNAVGHLVSMLRDAGEPPSDFRKDAIRRSVRSAVTRSGERDFDTFEEAVDWLGALNRRLTGLLPDFSFRPAD